MYVELTSFLNIFLKENVDEVSVYSGERGGWKKGSFLTFFWTTTLCTELLGTAYSFVNRILSLGSICWFRRCC